MIGLLALSRLLAAYVLVALLLILDGPRFPHRGSRPTWPSGEVQRTMKTSLGRMVKCWIPKIYLTNPSTESSTSFRPM
jgi:hypothetical protein